MATVLSGVRMDDKVASYISKIARCSLTDDGWNRLRQDIPDV